MSSFESLKKLTTMKLFLLGLSLTIGFQEICVNADGDYGDSEGDPALWDPIVDQYMDNMVRDLITVLPEDYPHDPPISYSQYLLDLEALKKVKGKNSFFIKMYDYIPNQHYLFMLEGLLIISNFETGFSLLQIEIQILAPKFYNFFRERLSDFET